MHSVVRWVTIVTAAGLSAACARPADPTPVASAQPPSAAESVGGRPELPAGWRWESFGGVQVGVPADWGWDNQAIRLDAWCIKPGNNPPAVSRPGAGVPAIGCGVEQGPPGEFLIKNTGWTVGFERTDEGDGTDDAGDRTTVRRDGVEVIIQAPKEWRDRIAATIHQVTVDSAGCPTGHRISTGPDLRPSPPVDVAALRDVTSISVCKYPLPDGFSTRSPSPRLLSSLRLDGPAAAEEIRQIAAAPVGHSLDTPADCLPEVAHGDQIILLLVRSATGTSEVTMRYAGCVQNGFDDGTTVRELTKTAVVPLIAGPNRVYGGFSGQPEKNEMLLPDE
ncbi:hypothetical protein Q0Z83_022490 [Actinoplanes sichuanensis]|uniref:Uncharacterized protein n=1 Tax=Actinoplanes sichuanensis TaxID=512349 RepID=A0ABW4AIF9_9ACTN|nr:hypothetical protein [Actinoplanes sichuanensis]BEL04058.1 hypothetical protein Q0Z83_022490 [Actinoplanes sichuanensis]